MDDTQKIKIHTKIGRIEVRPFEAGQFAAFGMISGSDNATVMKVFRALLTYSLGEEQASDLAVGMALGEYTLDDIQSLLVLIATKSAEVEKAKAALPEADLPAADNAG